MTQNGHRHQKNGQVTHKGAGKKGIVVNICHVTWFNKTDQFTIANAPERTANLSFTGDDLNFLSRVVYAESSGSGMLPDKDKRDKEKEAIINVIHFRLNRRGYPRNDYIARTFSAVCRAANQFVSVTPTPSPKVVSSAEPVYTSLNKGDCSDLQEAIDAVKKFMGTGPNQDYAFDNFVAGHSSKKGRVNIGGTHFWLSHTGKEMYDETP